MKILGLRWRLLAPAALHREERSEPVLSHGSSAEAGTPFADHAFLVCENVECQQPMLVAYDEYFALSAQGYNVHCQSCVHVPRERAW